MDPRPIELFFSTLGLVALAGSIGYLLLKLAGSFGKVENPSSTVEVASHFARRVTGWFENISLEVMALVAFTCMAGSLVMSEVLGYVPCLYCWIQRGFMYPAALILLVALTIAYRRGNPKVTRALVAAAVGLAALGLPVALFHRYQQDADTGLNFCSASVSCSDKWFDHFGFITIPALAGIGFFTICVFGIPLLRRMRAS